MKILFMSCRTGGGHNSAAKAVMEEMNRRGHEVTFLDPYTLKGKDLEKKVANGYVRMVQVSPGAFGMVYFLGNCYRHLPVHSPVYAVNKAMTEALSGYLQQHPFDMIVITHIYPGEILATLKAKKFPLPPILFISTDYVCQPFTEEIAADDYIIPTPLLTDHYARYGLPTERLFGFGIPVARAFTEKMTKEQAKKALGLSPSKRYFLLSGGSMGAGRLSGVVEEIQKYLAVHKDTVLIAICGENPHLVEKLKKLFGNEPAIQIMGRTDRMALYLKAVDIYFSKPGGLSSTEAAVTGVPLIHVTPIPGCETHNMNFFEKYGMSIGVGNDFGKLLDAVCLLSIPENAARMIEQQHRYIDPQSALKIGDLIEKRGISSLKAEKE